MVVYSNFMMARSRLSCRGKALALFTTIFSTMVAQHISEMHRASSISKLNSEADLDKF